MHGNMQPTEREQLKVYLDTYFDLTVETEPRSVGDLKKYFEAAAKYHKLEGLQPSSIS